MRGPLSHEELLDENFSFEEIVDRGWVRISRANERIEGKALDRDKLEGFFERFPNGWRGNVLLDVGKERVQDLQFGLRGLAINSKGR